MLVFLFILLILPTSLYSEQIIRSNLDLQEGASLLYRIKDDEALGEIMFIYSKDDELIPSRFIIETEQFKFGSLQLAGLWKYCAMDSLLNQSALKNSPGLTADRQSKRGLANPALSFQFSKKGSLMLISKEDYIQSALWASFTPGNYSSINSGLSIILPDTNPENHSESEWYLDKGMTESSALYHYTAEFSTERAKTSYRLYTAFSAAPLNIPGCSILPVFSYIERNWEFKSRFWYNSPAWVNCNLNKPESQYSWENNFNIMMNNQIRFLFKSTSSMEFQDNRRINHNLQGRGEFLMKPFFSILEYKLQTSEFSDELCTHDNLTIFAYYHLYSVRLSWTNGIWSSRAGFSIQHDKNRIQEWQASTELKRSFNTVYSSLKCSIKADPGELNIYPVFEEYLSLSAQNSPGSLGIRIRGGYHFILPATAYFKADFLSLSLNLEWKMD